jgi:transposase
MPACTLLDIAQEAQAQMLAALRRARYGYLLAMHVLPLSAAGRTPTESAACLFGSRSSVYRTVRAYRTGTLGCTFAEEGHWLPPVRTTVLTPALQRSLLALLKVAPRADGWGRTRWRCATLALARQRKRGLTVSAETLRRWLHEIGWGWKRPTPVAHDNAPHRLARLARLRSRVEPLTLCEAMVCADELDSPLRPKVGAAWRPKGRQMAVMTPGTNEKHDLAGALELSPGTLRHCCGPRNTTALVRELWEPRDDAYPAPQCQRVDVVVDN